MNPRIQEAIETVKAGLTKLLPPENLFLETPKITPFERSKYNAEFMARFHMLPPWPYSYSSKSDTRPHH